MQTLLVDCDTGIDDALALLYLLGDPAVELCGITTVFGNTTAAGAARNSLRVLDVAGRRASVPVVAGSELTLLGLEPERAAHVHGDDGLGGLARRTVSGLGEAGSEVATRCADGSAASGGPPCAAAEHAAVFVNRVTKERPGEVHLLATGPLTNLALALALDPGLVERVASVTIMGGAVHAPGNVTSRAEANIHKDPEAARRVLSAPWPVTLVPLDATMGEVLTEDHRRDLLGSGTATGMFAAEILDQYFDFYVSVYGRRAAACHDPLAAAIATGAVRPTSQMTVAVEVDSGYGPARGATLCDTRGRYNDHPVATTARCTVVLETDGTFPDRLAARLSGR